VAFAVTLTLQAVPWIRLDVSHRPAMWFHWSGFSPGGSWISMLSEILEGSWNLWCQRQSQPLRAHAERWRSKQFEVALALNFLDLAGMELWQWASASENEIR
jgi:hypothetical protein